MLKKQDKIKIAQTEARLRLMAGFKGFSVVEVPNLPLKWQDFPKSNDEWCGLEFPNSENTSGAIYKAKEKSVFDPHEHEGRKEHLMVMNEGGSMDVLVQGYGTYRVDYPNSIAIPEGVVHAVIFRTNTTLICVWHPKFKRGWEAKFKEEIK